MAETGLEISGHSYPNLEEIGEGLAHAMGTSLSEVRAMGTGGEGLVLRRRISLAILDPRIAPGTPRVRIGEVIGRSREAVRDYTNRNRPIDHLTRLAVNSAVKGYLENLH